MKSKKIIILLSSTIFTIFASLITSIFAWILPLEQISFDDATGSTAAAYFAGGDGTEDDPFIINAPVHLYNLAWLQYLGEFNETPIEQYYFEMDDDVDMTGWILPPIGTEQYPFFSSFNGNGHTVANLTVSNTNGNQDYEIKKTPISVTTVTDCDIIGFFGVVGDYKTHTASSITPSVKDVYLKDIVVNSNTSKTLVGIAVGYVNGDVSGIGVDTGDIYLNNSSVQYLDSTITQNISDFTLVGYCKDEYINSTSVTRTVVNTPTFSYHDFNYAGPEGTVAGSGGSIPMLDIYNRLNTIKGNTYSVQSSINPNNTHYFSHTQNIYKDVQTGETTYVDAPNGTARLYTTNHHNGTYNNKWGSFVFNDISSNSTTSQYLYLSGGQYNNYYNHVFQYNDSGYSISYNGTYLNLNANHSGVEAGADLETATIWHPTNNFNNNSTFYTTVDGVNYYLGYNRQNIRIQTDAYSTNLAEYDSSTGRLIGVNNGNDTALTYYNRSWTFRNVDNVSDNNLTFTANDRDVYKDILTDSKVNYTIDEVTYFPLSVIDVNGRNYNPVSNNTGYIISGSDDKTTSGTWPYKSGDIRVSYYSKSNLNDQSLNRVYTINGDGNHALTTTEKNEFVRFNKTRQSLLNTFSGNSNIYGLHFMNAQISMDNIVTANYVLINDNEYTNYQLPANCIDFHLKEQSVVNFIGGTYFDNNNSFFSLHKISRNGKNITSINEISEIFWDGNNDHSAVLKYKDDLNNDVFTTAWILSKGVPTTTYLEPTSSGYPNGYSSVFKTSWIKRNSIEDNEAYYFEFPMPQGEYALGSVDGGTGAYLMYLDISANAQKVVESTVAEKWTYETKTYISPFGVALVTSTDQEISNYDSIIALAIKSYIDKVGVTFISSETEGEPDTAEITCSNFTKLEILYKADLIDLVDSNNTELTNIVSQSSTSETHTRITYYDYNLTTGYTVITTILDGVTTITKVDADGNVVDFIDDEEDYYLNLEEHDTSVVATNNVLFEFTYRYLSSTEIQVDVTIDLNTVPQDGTTDDMIKTLNGYTFTFNMAYESDDIPHLTMTIIRVEDGYILTINDHNGVTVGQTFVVENI